MNDRVFVEDDDTETVTGIKIEFWVIAVMIIRHVQPFDKIGQVIDCFGCKIAGHHFLEAGYIWLHTVADGRYHLLFFFGMCFVFQDIEMFYIPAHHTKR